MSKIATILATLFLIVGAVAVSTPAQARWHHGWHGGSGFVFGWGWGGYPYPYYYGGPYYAAPACGWTHYRVWRHGHWIIRRAWRCW